MIRPNLRPAAMVLAILMISSNAGAQQPEKRDGTEPTTLNPGKSSGILTDRLTKSQLKAWRSIIEIVLAKDGEGRPIHPKLHALYQQAEASGQVIFVELTTQSSSYGSLGWSKVEPRAEGSSKGIVVLRLNLGLIGQARVSERNQRADGFIPFKGLGTKERYAEVLGHELTHAVLLLLDAHYLGLYRERKAKVYSSSPDSQSIDSLTSLIEGPAEGAEQEIWRELRKCRGTKSDQSLPCRND